MITLFSSRINKKFDFLLMLFLPIFAAIVSLEIRANFLTSAFLFFGLPSIWLSFRNRDLVKKVFLFSLILSIPFTTIIEYIAVIDGAWFIPGSFFSVWFFGVIQIETYIYGFMMVYAIVIFYEYFIDKGKNELFSERMRHFSFILFAVLMLFCAIFFKNSGLLNINYAYFWIGLFLIILPIILCFFNFPKFVLKYAKVAIYFLVLNTLHEMVGLELGQWTFPGSNFIGWVDLWKYKIPIEEFIFFLVLISFGVLTFYEYFDDDRK